MDVEEFDYDLPENLIAQKPKLRRDHSRLMCLNKDTGDIKEDIFKDITEYFDQGDMIIFNNSQVIPARLYGKKIPTGTEIEILLLTELKEGRWEVLVRPGKRVKKGVKVSFGNDKLIGEAVEYTDFGGRIMEFTYDGDFDEIIEELGEMPLPPYIEEKLDNPDRYQTVYAKKRGSAAAPTAGLHFTPELIAKLEKKGVIVDYITLHVGLGTFRPVRTKKVEEHDMHSEYYEINKNVVDNIRKTKENDNRIIAVGTTVTRTLESAAQNNKELTADKGWTDIFIYPDYDFKVIDGLVTNFHLPKSTLLMLVSAFAGKEKVFKAYRKAVEEEYRFFSLGDAMFIY